jgi:hypothetical protein
MNISHGENVECELRVKSPMFSCVCGLGLNNENPTQRRKGAESAKGLEDNEKRDIYP